MQNFELILSRDCINLSYPNVAHFTQTFPFIHRRQNTNSKGGALFLAVDTDKIDVRTRAQRRCVRTSVWFLVRFFSFYSFITI